MRPSITPAKSGGNTRNRDMRDDPDDPMSVPSTGCQRRAAPKDLPPRGTVCGHFDLWDRDGMQKRIHKVPHVACRERAEREAGPTIAITGPQTVKSAAEGKASIDPDGYDAGKKIKSRKRQVLVDMPG